MSKTTKPLARKTHTATTPKHKSHPKHHADLAAQVDSIRSQVAENVGAPDGRGEDFLSMLLGNLGADYNREAGPADYRGLQVGDRVALTMEDGSLATQAQATERGWTGPLQGTIMALEVNAFGQPSATFAPDGTYAVACDSVVKIDADGKPIARLVGTEDQSEIDAEAASEDVLDSAAGVF